MKRFFITIIIFLSGSMTCFCQQTFENRFVLIQILTERKTDSVEFKLNVTNKSDESIFLPMQNALHSRVWKSSTPQDFIELELGYDLKMVTESIPSFFRIETGQTETHTSKVAVKDDKHYVIKFKANLFMSNRKIFHKKERRLEWFALDFKLP